MTAEFAVRLGMAAAETLKGHGVTRPRFIVGMDTRQSSPMLAHAVTAGITARGGDVHWLSVMPTPGVAYLTRALEGHAGVVVSASHNPFTDNGIKFFNHDGEKLPDDLEASIEARLQMDTGNPEAVTEGAIGHSSRYRRQGGEYESFLLENAPYLDGLRVGLDCANGASFEIAPYIFNKIGARLDVINADPDGRNINLDCGSTHPGRLRMRVQELGLEVGVSFDGDGDRAILVDSRGRLVSGDHILAICALSRGEREVVGTVMSNLGVESYLGDRGVTLHRTQVGDRYVFQELRHRRLQLGGEQSGHVIFLDKAPTGDGILTALQVLAAVRKSDTPLERWLDEIPIYPQTLVNVRVDPARKHDLAGHQAITQVVEQAEEKLAGKGRINLRPSGTEPLIRVMVEGPDEGIIDDIAREVAAAVTRVAEQ